MVRIRHQDGSVTDVDDLEATEILGDDGALALVIITDHRKTIRVAAPGEPLFLAYARSNGLKAAKVFQHEPLPVERPAV